MKKIHILTRENLLTHGQISGGGLRVLGLAGALGNGGFKVIISMPEAYAEQLTFSIFDYSNLDDDIGKYPHLANIPNMTIGPSFYAHRIDSVIKAVSADILLFEQWELASWSKENQAFRIVDLHGSLLAENAFRGHGDNNEASLAKIQALASADLVLCAGSRQKSWFMAWCAFAGHPLKSLEILDIPLFVWGQSRPRKISKDPQFLFSGRLWPWIDPFPGLKILCEKTAASKTGKMIIRAEGMVKCDPLTGIDLSKEASTELNILESYMGHPKIDIQGFVGHKELLDLISKCHAAFDLYQDNNERWLAFSTRTAEFLWAGLPVIHSASSLLAPYIEKYDAGWVLDPNDQKKLGILADRILQGKEKIQDKSKGARLLAKEILSGEKGIEPLLLWLEKPVKKSANAPIHHFIQEKTITDEKEENLRLNEENRLLRKRFCDLKSQLAEAKRQLADKGRPLPEPLYFKLSRYLWLTFKRYIFDYPSLLLLMILHRLAFAPTGKKCFFDISSLLEGDKR